jgi:hypothetical protein
MVGNSVRNAILWDKIGCQTKLLDELNLERIVKCSFGEGSFSDNKSRRLSIQAMNQSSGIPDRGKNMDMC